MTSYISISVLQPTGFSPDIFSMVQRSDLVSQLVMLSLLVFSVLSWWIILRKQITFHRVSKESIYFIDVFRKSSKLSEVQALCPQLKYSPLPGIFLSGYKELNAQIKVTSQRQKSSEVELDGGPRYAVQSMIGLQRALQRASVAELSILERSLPWLATTASVTPFVGLLGTVMGIIHAFNGLSMEKATTIQAVAPGISAALIATAAGLFAAIPAVIFYNHFLGKIKIYSAEMDDFSMEFLNLIERNFT